MDISKLIRKNKDYIKESKHMPTVPNLTKIDKIKVIINENGGRATFSQINRKLPIDKGNLSNSLTLGTLKKVWKKMPCPHCKGNDIYVLNS